jgi:hypothetical protein
MTLSSRVSQMIQLKIRVGSGGDDPRVKRLSVEGCDVVAGNRSPERIAAIGTGSPFDAHEQPFDARPVGKYPVVDGPDMADLRDLSLPTALGLDDQRNKVLAPAKTNTSDSAASR